MTKSVYSTTKAGTPLLQTLSAGCRTPILTVKYCNLIKPFYYPNCRIPRYSVTCIIDPRTDEQFLQFIKTIEKNEGIDTAVRPDYHKDRDGMPVTTGNFVIKFQSKEKICVKVSSKDVHEQPMKLEDDLAPGEKVSVIYDVLRYTKRGSVTEHGLSFKPIEIIYHPPESTKHLSQMSSADDSFLESEGY